MLVYRQREQIKKRYKRLQILIRLLILVLGFWCLTPLSTIFKLYRGGPFS